MILPEAKFGAYFYFLPEENLFGYTFFHSTGTNEILTDYHA